MFPLQNDETNLLKSHIRLNSDFKIKKKLTLSKREGQTKVGNFLHQTRTKAFMRGNQT